MHIFFLLAILKVNSKKYLYQLTLLISPCDIYKYDDKQADTFNDEIYVYTLSLREACDIMSRK